MHMQVKKKLLRLVVPCTVQTKHIQGSFLPARTAAKMALASSLLYAPVWVQFTSYIPACLSHSHQPHLFVSKLQKLAEALQKINTFPTGKPFGACIPVWQKTLQHQIANRTVSTQVSFRLVSKCCCFVATQMTVNSPATNTRNVVHDTFP